MVNRIKKPSVKQLMSNVNLKTIDNLMLNQLIMKDLDGNTCSIEVHFNRYRPMQRMLVAYIFTGKKRKNTNHFLKTKKERILYHYD